MHIGHGLGYLAITLAAIPALATETLTLRYPGHGDPMGIFVFRKGQEGPISKTYLVVVRDRGKTLPSAYLDYRFSISDVMPPWTSSEYTAIREDDGRLNLKRRKVTVSFLENTPRTREINGVSLNTSCGIYDPQGTTLIAYCTTWENDGTFYMKNLDGNELANFSKVNSKGDWEINLRTSTTDVLQKSIAIQLAGFAMWYQRN